MPFKSEAQRRYFNANRKELEAQGVDVDEWNNSSRGKKLPDRIKNAGSRWRTIENLGRVAARLAPETFANTVNPSRLNVLAKVQPKLSGKLPATVDDLSNKIVNHKGLNWVDRTQVPAFSNPINAQYKPKFLYRGHYTTQKPTIGGYGKSWAHGTPSVGLAEAYARGASSHSPINLPGVISVFKPTARQRYYPDFALEQLAPKLVSRSEISGRKQILDDRLLQDYVKQKLESHMTGYSKLIPNAIKSFLAKRDLSRRLSPTRISEDFSKMYNQFDSIRLRADNPYETPLRANRNPYVGSYLLSPNSALGSNSTPIADKVAPLTDPKIRQAIESIARQAVATL